MDKIRMKKLNIIAVVAAAIAVVGAGAYAGLTRMQRDHQAPEIFLDGETITCSINATDEELKQGVTAQDSKDGDLTDRVLVDNIHILDADTNLFEISYVVFDSDNHVASESRNLIYSDYHSPRYVLDSPLQFSMASRVDIYSYLRAYDCIDGDISKQIYINMDDDVQDMLSYGDYCCEVRVTNSLGDTAEIPLTFDIIDASYLRPVISLTDNITYVKKGSDFDPYKYLSTVNIENVNYQLIDQDLIDQLQTDIAPYGFGYSNSDLGVFISKDEISISANIDMSEEGTYMVVYSIVNPKTNREGFVRLHVVVEK